MANKTNSISLVVAVIIFMTAILSLYAITGLEKAESYVATPDSEFTDTTFSENEIIRTLIEIDNFLLTSIAELKEDLGVSLFILDYHNFM